MRIFILSVIVFLLFHFKIPYFEGTDNQILARILLLLYAAICAAIADARELLSGNKRIVIVKKKDKTDSIIKFLSYNHWPNNEERSYARTFLLNHVKNILKERLLWP